MAALSFDTFATELVLEIADHLTVEDVYNLFKVSKNMNSILKEKVLTKDAQSCNPRALIWAVKHGDLSLAAASMDAGSDARTTYEHTYPTEESDPFRFATVELIYLAIEKNYTEMACLLYSRGAQAERVDRGWASYLYMAIMHDNPVTIDICLRSPYTNYTDLNFRHLRSNLRNFWSFNPSGFVPLQVAIEHGRTNAVQRLLMDSRVEVRGALTCACKVEIPKQTIFKLLLGQRKPFPTTETGFALLTVCQRWQDADAMTVVPNLLSRPIDDVDLYDSLSAACENGSFETVKLISGVHQHLSSLNRAMMALERQDPGDPPLVTASGTGRLDLVTYLCDQGFKVDQPGSAGRLPIHSAAARGHMEVVKLLHSRGADLFARDDRSRSCLDLAVEQSRPRRFEDLLNLGFDPMQRKADGSTLLWAACKSKNRVMIERLIELNVPIDAINIHGHSVFFNLFWQYTKTSSSILQLLLRHLTEKQISVFETNFLAIAVNAQDAELVKALLANCNKTEARDSIIAVFHEVCQLNKINMIEVMLDHDSTLAAAPNFDGYLPMYHLLKYSDSGLESLRLLLQHNANPSIAVSRKFLMDELFSAPPQEKGFETTPFRSNVLSELQRYPLHFSCSRGDVELAILLTQYGADVDKKDNCNMTPLHHACIHNQYRCAELLLKHGSDTTKSYSMPQNDTKYTPYVLALDNDATEMIELLSRYDEEKELKRLAEAPNEAGLMNAMRGLAI